MILIQKFVTLNLLRKVAFDVIWLKQCNQVSSKGKLKNLRHKVQSIWKLNNSHWKPRTLRNWLLLCSLSVSPPIPTFFFISFWPSVLNGSGLAFSMLPSMSINHNLYLLLSLSFSITARLSLHLSVCLSLCICLYLPPDYSLCLSESLIFLISPFPSTSFLRSVMSKPIWNYKFLERMQTSLLKTSINSRSLIKSTLYA